MTNGLSTAADDWAEWYPGWKANVWYGPQSWVDAHASDFPSGEYNYATLVDLSISGAQLVSQAALKPNRMVRVQLPAGDNPITCKGKIVWARLEAGSTTGLRYRAGVFFTGVDERAIEKFLAEYVANQPAG